MATRRKRLWLNFLGGYGGIGETLNLLDPGKAYKLMLDSYLCCVPENFRLKCYQS